jgi:hypothetical protein
VRFLLPTTVLIAALATSALARPAAADEPLAPSVASFDDAEPIGKPVAKPVAKPTAKPLSPLGSVVGADWVAVTLAADDPHVALYAKEPRKVALGDAVVDGWTFVCFAPCGDLVDPHRAYRVMGESILPSVEFNVAPGSVSIAVDVHTRRPRSPTVTTTLAAAGTVSGVGGILLLLVDLVEHGAASALGASSVKAKHQLEGSADTFGDAGAGMLVGGILLGGAALVYIATAGKTVLAPSGTTTRSAQAGSGDGVHLIPFGFTF